jgi:membrane protein DedA with SNARE-associated domain
MQILTQLNDTLLSLAEKIPLEQYVFIGGLLEEIIAPIPSPIIMTTAGGLHALDNGMLWGIVLLALIAALGKTIGSVVLYYLADWGEDFVVAKFGKYLGLSEKGLEKLSDKFNGGWKDIVVLTFLRALPIIPGAPVAVACGAIKLDMKVYLISTYIGTFIRSLFFAYIGFIGAESYTNVIEGLDSIETVLTIATIFIIFGGIWYVKKNSEGND